MYLVTDTVVSNIQDGLRDTQVSTTYNIQLYTYNLTIFNDFLQIGILHLFMLVTMLTATHHPCSMERAFSASIPVQPLQLMKIMIQVRLSIYMMYSLNPDTPLRPRCPQR